MFWQPLSQFDDATIPKLNNLRLAAEAGLRVPPTWWIHASEVGKRSVIMLPPLAKNTSLMLRSGSPSEDQADTSNAGQFVSTIVQKSVDFAPAMKEVADALPKNHAGEPQGVVFAQPLIGAAQIGVAFYDGYYFERTLHKGRGEDITGGKTRGNVERGQWKRNDDWSDWIARIHNLFIRQIPKNGAIDVEFAQDDDGYLLLQVRPALFPVYRNRSLTLANHKELYGRQPSPWMLSALIEAGKRLEFLAELNPEFDQWDEPYAIELAGQPWLNLSLWFRWMDQYGLPRQFATRGVGGESDEEQGRRVMVGRFLRSVPALFGQQWRSLRHAYRAKHSLKQLDRRIKRAQSLAELFDATVAGLDLALNTNFAISALFTGWYRLRRFLRVPGQAELITQKMMQSFERISSIEDTDQREIAMGRWLREFGHRGPLESDLARPRFIEMSSQLKGATIAPSSDTALSQSEPASVMEQAWRPFFWIDEHREWFRHATMRRWLKLRRRMLQEAKELVENGTLDAQEDIFWLRGEDLLRDKPLRECVAANRKQTEAYAKLELPLTANRQEIESLLTQAEIAQTKQTGQKRFAGISLGHFTIEGRVLKAEDLTALLALSSNGTTKLEAQTILVVPTLEPAWAVVFPKIGGVVSELGGELSHASILLREANKPAIVNCGGIFREVKDGDRLKLDGKSGIVEVL